MQVANHIDSWSGARSERGHEIMPQDDPKPSVAERYQLSEWIACGKAKQGAGDAGVDASIDGNAAADAGVDAP
jgi:hypothetical protein